MELIFLGTGTSQGVPMIAHQPVGLDLKDTRNWRTRSSIHVIMDGFHVQVDAAQEFRIQCLREHIEKLDLFILTHGHADHISGMDDLRRFCELRGEALSIYANHDGLERIRSIYPYAIRDVPLHPGYPAFKLHEMPAQLSTPGGDIYSTPLPHGSIEVLGLVFIERSTQRKLVYYCDCKTLPAHAQEIAKDADVVVLDGLRPQEHPTHMNIEQAVHFAQVLNAPRSYLIHMAFLADHATVSATLPQGVELSYDGLRVQI
ncbi:MAG: MBL fold metallo-hydrolase [Verrucomicrobia bacterium 21-51-4]|nr:MAG: MBL fold metallo-hydrolase [Verrucomicrobia bacterium 21-51-4]